MSAMNAKCEECGKDFEPCDVGDFFCDDCHNKPPKATYDQLVCNVHSLATELDRQRKRAAEAESDLATWKARAEKAEAQVNEMKQHFDQKFKCLDVYHPDGTKEELAVPAYNDTVGDECLTAEAIYHIDFVKAKYRMTKAESERDNLKALCGEMKERLTHKPNCRWHKTCVGGYGTEFHENCNCGLDELLKKVSAV